MPKEKHGEKKECKSGRVEEIVYYIQRIKLVKVTLKPSKRVGGKQPFKYFLPADTTWECAERRLRTSCLLLFEMKKTVRCESSYL